jgi:hypothetical protein
MVPAFGYKNVPHHWCRFTIIVTHISIKFIPILILQKLMFKAHEFVGIRNVNETVLLIRGLGGIRVVNRKIRKFRYTALLILR